MKLTNKNYLLFLNIFHITYNEQFLDKIICKSPSYNALVLFENPCKIFTFLPESSLTQEKYFIFKNFCSLIFLPFPRIQHVSSQNEL